MQDLNYLTAAYYLSQKYDKNDEWILIYYLNTIVDKITKLL